MNKIAFIFLLSILPVLHADVPFDSIGDDTWRQVTTLGQYPASGVDIHANCDTAGNMYMLGGCTYGNAAEGTHNADVFRFDLKTGNAYRLYTNATNPVRISCQVAQAYDKTRDCIWFSWGDIWTAARGLYRFQCPNGPITKASDTALGLGWRGVCYLYHDPVNDLLIAPNMYGMAIRHLATGDTEQVDYPRAVDASIPNVNELPSCFDTKRGLFVMTQWGGCWCAGGAEPVNPPILHDLWLYNTTSRQWEVRSPAVTPGPNFSAEMAYDSQNDKYVYFGSGRLGYGLPELWVYDYDTNTWTQVRQNGRTFLRSNLAASTWPAQRYKHAWTYCEKYNVLVSWGGYNYIAAEAGVVFDSNDVDFFTGAHQPLWYYRLYKNPPSAADGPVLPASVPSLEVSPNPFNSSVILHLPEAGASLRIFSLDGKLATDLSDLAAPGRRVAWNAGAMPPGVYLIRCTSGSRTWTARAVLAR